METNEMILNVIKSLISEEQIDEAIKAAEGDHILWTTVEQNLDDFCDWCGKC